MSADIPPLVEGLADGVPVDDPLDEPEPEVPGLLGLVLGLLLPELPDVPVEPPVEPCAAARTGARPMTITRSVNSNFFIISSFASVGLTGEPRWRNLATTAYWPPATTAVREGCNLWTVGRLVG
jgi:hypothetical protein